jgi:hypothetical protein
MAPPTTSRIRLAFPHVKPIGAGPETLRPLVSLQMAQTGLAAAFVVPIASTARGEPMMSYETYVRFCPDCGYTEESGDQDFLFMVRECPACALLGPIMYRPPIFGEQPGRAYDRPPRPLWDSAAA